MLSKFLSQNGENREAVSKGNEDASVSTLKVDTPILDGKSKGIARFLRQMLHRHIENASNPNKKLQAARVTAEDNKPPILGPILKEYAAWLLATRHQ